MHRRSSIVLDHSKVSGVEGGEELGQLCENVEEMILSGNEIKQWSHVSNDIELANVLFAYFS